METPKPPARSQIRRSSTRPYVRRAAKAATDDSGPPADRDTASGPLLDGASAPAPIPEVAPPRRRTARKAATVAQLDSAARTGSADDDTHTLVAPSLDVAASDVPREPLSVDLPELPAPRHLPRLAPTTPAPAPGRVPRGDSRSLRRADQFALVYRADCFVVIRHGQLGQEGHWSTTEYPTPAAASHAYARACSSWVSEGFSDYRG